MIQCTSILLGLRTFPMNIHYFKNNIISVTLKDIKEFVLYYNEGQVILH